MATVVYSPYITYVVTVTTTMIKIHTDDGTKVRVNPRTYRRQMTCSRLPEEVKYWLVQYLNQYYPQVDVVMTKVGKDYVATRIPNVR